MGALDLNKVAIAMGKILLALPDLEAKGTDFFSINCNKEEYFSVAYMARVSILDIIEENSFMRNGSLPITIPLGIFKTRKETMESALEITVGKLLDLANEHEQVSFIINDILKRGKYFYQFEKMLPPEVLSQLNI